MLNGIPFNTDQGGEFTGGELTRVCARAGITQSMGRTGSALDNAVSESFHSTLEFELLSRNRFATHDQARPAVVAWLQEYNTVRLHSTNGMVAPVEFEHGRRRPGAKSYDQLRRRRYHPSARQNQDDKIEAEAAAPPETLIEPLRDPHRRRAVSGPALEPQGPLPRSLPRQAAVPSLPRRARTQPLTPEPLRARAGQPQRQATACRRTRATQPDQDP